VGKRRATSEAVLQRTLVKSNVTTDVRLPTREQDEVIAELERQRRDSENERERLYAVLANMRDAVLVVDTDGNVVLSNAAYDALFAGSVNILNAAGQRLAPSETPKAKAARGESFTMAFRIAGAEGAVHWFEANAQPVDFPGGRLSVVLIRDISERSLRLLQEEFIAIASHELRTPLTAVQAYVQLLARRPEIRDNPTLAGYVDSALAESKRLAGLIAELTEATRLQSGGLQLERRRVDLRTLIERVVDVSQPLSDTQAIRFDAPHEVTATVDPGRIEQVLFNLLTNAMTHAADSRYVDVELRGVDGHADIRVTDAGPGIPAADVGQLFSRFFQVSRSHGGTERGLGLGLYIAREIVRAHGGTLTVESAVGQGTTFTIRLPLGAGEV
jgi:two-component system CheB/CheR fusion protein